MATLPDKLEEALKTAETYKGFVDRAAEQASKFSPEVIERVVSGHRKKLSNALEVLRPLVAEAQSAVAACVDEIASVQGGVGSSGSELEELNLRLLIGELTEEEFETAASSRREDVESASDRVASVQVELDGLNGLLARSGDVLNEDLVVAPSTPTSESLDVEDDAEPESEASESVGSTDDDPIESGNADGLFADDASEEVSPADVEDDLDLDDLEEEEEEEEEDDLVLDDLDLDEADEDLQLDTPVTTIEAPVEDEDDLVLNDVISAPESSGKKNNAALIYREGTEDEEAFGIEKDEVWMGRRRDVNDIMVKNDAKVSRFHHCRIFRREGSFFIEDPKSSNGTLVNGDRLPNGEERRLYGDEEVTIGETYYRFRIVD
jgi:hypothetical protein